MQTSQPLSKRSISPTMRSKSKTVSLSSICTMERNSYSSQTCSKCISHQSILSKVNTMMQSCTQCITTRELMTSLERLSPFFSTCPELTKMTTITVKMENLKMENLKTEMRKVKMSKNQRKRRRKSPLSIIEPKSRSSNKTRVLSSTQSLQLWTVRTTRAPFSSKKCSNQLTSAHTGTMMVL